MPAISVIVPVYNAKKYLGQAIDSILNQTFKNFEVILVDDCSTDGTYEYMKSMWDGISRIRIVKNVRNMGPDPTRNYGMRLARGKYLAFMDNDDCYLPDLLLRLYELAEKYQADVVTCMGFFHSDQESIPEDLSGKVHPDLDSNYQDNIVVAPDNIMERMDGWLRNEYNIACWNKLYLKDFLSMYDIRFRPNSDDRGFVFSCLINARKYIKTPYIGNIYRSVQTSLSRNHDSGDMEKLDKAIIGLDGFSRDFMEIMREVPFFQEHPEYSSMILTHQLGILERAGIMHYFPGPNAISG